MPLVTPTLNLPQPAMAATPARAGTPVAVAPAAAAPEPSPSATVTLSPQAQSALAAAHAAPSPSASLAITSPAAATTHDDSVYESLKHGISAAVTDMGDAIAGGAHAVVDGVETTLSTANTAFKGLLGLPFAAAAKACDAAGALIDEL